MRPPCRRRITTEADFTGTRIAPDAEEDEAEETGPLRRCIVTRERLGKERMIRFVLGPAPDGKARVLVPDIAADLPGRGIWLSARRDVLETARAQGSLTRAFARAARGPVTVPPDLTSVLQAALVRRIGELLGLARRAGQAVAGFQKAREWLRAGQAGLVLQAADGSADERMRFLSGAAPGLRVFAPLPAEALGRIFGRDRAVHVAVAPGRLADALAIEAGRLAGLVGLDASGGGAAGSDELNKRTGA
jgi:predicted RNA-binding protein YlxR (DUF448 family)